MKLFYLPQLSERVSTVPSTNVLLLIECLIVDTAPTICFRFNERKWIDSKGEVIATSDSTEVFIN